MIHITPCFPLIFLKFLTFTLTVLCKDIQQECIFIAASILFMSEVSTYLFHITLFEFIVVRRNLKLFFFNVLCFFRPRVIIAPSLSCLFASFVFSPFLLISVQLINYRRSLGSLPAAFICPSCHRDYVSIILPTLVRIEIKAYI